jgi:hypothetical protein
MASLLERLHAQVEAHSREGDPWLLPLERLQGNTGADGIERVTTQAVFDVLGVPQRDRRAGAYRRLAKVMTELSWTAVRVRGFTRGGYLEQVRGYCRTPAGPHQLSHGGSYPQSASPQ